MTTSPFLEARRSGAQVANDRDWRGQLAAPIARALLDGFEPVPPS